MREVRTLFLKHPPNGLVIAAALGLLVFSVYAATLAPTVFWGDSAELSTSAYFLGIPHPPGYPLYSILGKLFISVIPFGDPGYRMNLLSAVSGALTVVVIFQLLRRVGGNIMVAVAVALALGFSYRFWRNSIIAEVYTLHTLLLALMLLLLLLWRDSGRKKYAYVACAVFGLSLAHHGMTILLLPGLLYGLFFARPVNWKLKEIAGAAALAAAGLSFYAYLPLRYAQQPAFNLAKMVEADITRPADLLWYLSGGLFRGQITEWDLGRIYTQLGTVLGASVADYMIVGALLAYAGAVVQYKRDTRLFLLLLAILLPNLAFLAAYPVPDIDDFAVVLTVIISPWVAIGLSFLGTEVFRHTAARLQLYARGRMAYSISVIFVLGLFAAGPFFLNLQYLNYSDKYAARSYAREVLASLPDQAVLFMQFPAAPLWYVQMVEGKRQDVTLVDRTFLFLKKRALSRNSKREEVISKLNAELLDTYKDRSLFVVSYDPDIAAAWTFEDLGAFYGLKKKGLPLVRNFDGGESQGGLVFGNSLRLQSANVEPTRVVAGRLLKLTLEWVVGQDPPSTQDPKLLFRFENSTGEGNTVGSPSFAYAMRQGYGAWHPHEWPPGRLVEESYDLYVPMETAAGAYKLRLMLSDGDSTVQAFDNTGGGPFAGAVLGEITVEALKR